MFPNLLWAMALQKIRQYELSHTIRITESRFSRCVRGIGEFSSAERKQIAAALGYAESWLFAEMVPPMPPKSEMSGEGCRLSGAVEVESS